MYVIAGVTGNTGKVAAEALIARGAGVRVVVRDAEKGAAWAAKGAEVAVADLGDTAALTRALDGATGAYLLVPPNFAAADFRAYQRATTDAMAAAVRAAKVPHVVLLSSIGAELPEGTGPIAGLHHTEAALSSIPGTSLTAIRAGYFVENVGGSLGALAHGVFPTFFPADLAIDMITTRDIGALAAALLLEGARESSVVQLGGPGVSAEDIADALGRVTGQRPQVLAQPASAMAQALQGFGVPAEMARLYQEMTEAVIAGAIHFHPELRRIDRQTSVDEVLRGLLGR